MRDARVALVVGGTAWVVSAATYMFVLGIRGRTDAPVALLYNLPIAFLFLVSLAFLVVRGARFGLQTGLRTHGLTIFVWSVGFVLLYLRLVSKSLDVSGHLAWLPMLTTQLWLWRFPAWVIAFGVLSTVVALYMKLAIFQGPSGIPGLVVGLFLATTLVALSRMREDRAVEQ